MDKDKKSNSGGGWGTADSANKGTKKSTENEQSYIWSIL
jgi:hypothetical protein